MNDIPRLRNAREGRLRGRDNILRIFDSGLSARRGTVIARFVFSDPSSPSLRVGVAASRRISTAVARNRCKRLLREAVRPLRDGVEVRLAALKRSADVMFIYSGTPDRARSQRLAEISQSVSELFELILSSPRRHDADSHRAH